MELGQGLKYPWANASRLWNILWVLVPILGPFAVLGYVVKIVKAIVAGDKTGLPAMDGFLDSTKEGFMLFLKSIPLMIVFYIAMLVLMFIPIIGWLAIIVIELFLLPWLFVNLMVKGTIGASFDFTGVSKAVFGNLGEYVMALLKTIVYVVAYEILSIVLVGIPCLQFGSMIFLAEFYADKQA